MCLLVRHPLTRSHEEQDPAVSKKYNVPGTMCFALEENCRLHGEYLARVSVKPV